MKLALAATEGALHAVRSTAEDWLRLGFGPNARFTAFVAEARDAPPIGMVTCSERYYTGWPEPALYVGDLFVEPPYRSRGIARALLGRVARLAIVRNSPMVELTVGESNAAQGFYRRCGFSPVAQCLHYVAAGDALAKLAAAVQDPAALDHAMPAHGT